MNTKMRYRGFTIIEVLVAVMILASVTTILFQISSNSKNNYIFYKKKIDFENISSFGIVEDKFSNTNLYEQLKTKYNIDSDELRKKLKSIKIQKRIKQFSQKDVDENIKIIINQVNINSDKKSSNYFSIWIN